LDTENHQLNQECPSYSDALVDILIEEL
jgi:hypothetical protein